MRLNHPAALLALAVLTVCAALGAAPVLKPGSATIGRNLQTYATVALSEPASTDLQVTLTTADPARLLLSKLPDLAGSPSITLIVKARFRETPEFWLHALADSGKVNYSVSAPGFDTAAGTVTLTPAGIVIMGPFGQSVPTFITTPRAWPSKIVIRAMRLDESLNCVEPQFIRGGLSAKIRITNSQPAAGAVAASDITIPAAADTALTEFRPAGVGQTSLSVTPPPGFSMPAQLNSVSATVRAPGLAAATDMTIGENLQTPAALSLGEPAPKDGLTVTLTSHDPGKLLLSETATDPGRAEITIKMPTGSVNGTYYLQALAGSGTVTHTAAAPGHVSRTGTLALAPSGVIISLPAHGPPDEAELFRPESAGSHQNIFVALLSEGRSTPLIVYTAYLDPATRRSADITVQALRAGLTLPIDVGNANPSVGKVDSRVTIQGGADRALLAFTPATTGKTVISVSTPKGFTKPSNATELLAIVKD